MHEIIPVVADCFDVLPSLSTHIRTHRNVALVTVLGRAFGKRLVMITPHIEYSSIQDDEARHVEVMTP